MNFDASALTALIRSQQNKIQFTRSEPRLAKNSNAILCFAERKHAPLPSPSVSASAQRLSPLAPLLAPQIFKACQRMSRLRYLRWPTEASTFPFFSRGSLNATLSCLFDARNFLALIRAAGFKRERELQNLGHFERMGDFAWSSLSTVELLPFCCLSRHNGKNGLRDIRHVIRGLVSERPVIQTLRCLFSPVSKPIFATKYSFESV